MSSRLMILFVGGPADATAMLSSSPPSTFQVASQPDPMVQPSDGSPPQRLSPTEEYRLVRLRSDTRGARLPHLAYVHSSIQDRDAGWQAFMSFIRAFDRTMQRGPL